MQLLDQEVHGLSGLGSAVPVPSLDLVPTLPPAPNQFELSFGLGLGLAGSIGEADLHWEATSEGENVAMDFSPGPFEVQIPSSASSSSDGDGYGNASGSQRREQRKPKKKEESGSCDKCHRSFSRRSDARRHNITAHKTEGYEYACSQCPIKCSRKDALLRHIRDQH